jgi:CCR4-NOT transcription complex subunit 1
LLNLSDKGIYTNCIELFKFPITHCPDLLILGLLQLNVIKNSKKELFTALYNFIYYTLVSLIYFHFHFCCCCFVLTVTKSIWNKLKQEILSVLIPIFLGNHPNSAVILQHAWNQTNNTSLIRTLIMNSMTDWYMKAQEAEQSIRLARILDVSQDLKALSILLSGQPMIFNIDLACLAARRGYLKLDKWMSDRIRDHGVNSILRF